MISRTLAELCRQIEMLAQGNDVADACGTLLAELEREHARVDRSVREIIATAGSTADQNAA